ncbi:MAG: ABC transporter ATP-binding protein, partial [Firmicutes bacterium]|nr:ABC transporter ATP-binding protein [Bacillota bacterium]
LMDEPLSNLDANVRKQMRSEVIQLFNQMETTFIYVTHDQTEALTMATDIVVMKNGVIMQHGSPQDVYRNPQNIFVAQFIGDPGMNVIRTKASNYIGIKPRALRPVKEQENGLEFQAKVLTREFLGVDYQYTLDIGIGHVVMRAKEELAVGADTPLYADMDEVFYFDENQNRCEAFVIAEMEGVYHADE